MECPEHGVEMELVDTTYSNYDSPRYPKGTHTGDIYRCPKCEEYYDLWIYLVQEGIIEKYNY